MSNRIDTTIMSAAMSLDADGASTTKNVGKYDKYCVQCVFTYGGGADAAGTATLQGSADGIHWSDVPDSTQNYTSSVGNVLWSVSAEAAYPYIRVSVNQTSMGTPGATASVLFQGWYSE